MARPVSFSNQLRYASTLGAWMLGLLPKILLSRAVGSAGIIGLASASLIIGVAGPLVGPVAAQSLDEIIEELITDGTYLDGGSDQGLDQATIYANQAGVVFAWLNTNQDAEGLAHDLVRGLEARGSGCDTVLVLTNSGIGAWSVLRSESQIGSGLDASFASLRDGFVADGVTVFADTLGGPQSATACTQRAGGSVPGPGQESGSSSDGNAGGIGLGTVIVGGAIIGGGTWGALSLLSRSKRKKRLAAEMEQDRAEIKQQLQSNADRVIELADKAMASGDHELITAYEQASHAYQQVSLAIDDATEPQDVDALDDKIDHAEWQFEMIEARLAGQPVPPSPAEVAAAAQQAKDAATGRGQDRPALGPDESVVGSPADHAAGTHGWSTGHHGGGGLGGGLGGLGGVLMGGGGLGGYRRRPYGSRRSQRRRPRLGGRAQRPSGGGGRGFGQRGGGGGRQF